MLDGMVIQNEFLPHIIGVLLLVLIILIRAYYLTRKRNSYYEVRFKDVLDVESEVEKLTKSKTNLDQDIEKLRASYAKKYEIFEALTKQAAVYDEEIELAELGFYKPRFDYKTSEVFKEVILLNKEKQKRMVSNKTAVFCHTEWTLEGSRAKGRTMTNRGIRLTARAFNNECETSILKVKWNNAERMVLRIEKVFEAINKLNASNQIFIAREYKELKIKELLLTHEYKEKKQREKEEQTEIRRQMREEARFEQDMANAIQEEDKFQRMLVKAKGEAEKTSGEKLSKLEAKIQQLEKDLEIAHEKSERAKSMAQLTKAGHVYVISNIGSFGEDIYKIGMTRRLEPLDRVKELGDASVPFVFDVHAMIYSENAPELEKEIHKVFDEKRVNLVNNRKEFFSVQLPEIQSVVETNFGSVEFHTTAEARDYNESKAIRAHRLEVEMNKVEITDFPEAI